MIRIKVLSQFLMSVLLGLLFTQAVVASEYTQGVPKLGSTELFQPADEFTIFGKEEFNDTYQIGDEWGKIEVTEKVLSKSSVYRRTAGATAKVGGGGTGFYLGKFKGAHIVATNYHVCPSDRRCLGEITFPVLGKSFQPVNFLGRWTEIDLALFEIEVNSAADEAVLAAVAKNFSFNRPIRLGQKIVTIGFGVANNRRRKMVANFDSDCVVFSGNNEFRLMADPDDLNPGPYKAWSFANGCDVSHGDSGSAMVDRQTGDVMGIIWTGKIPKNARVRNSRYLEKLLKQPNDDTWKELSYAVPASKMKEVLERKLSEGSVKGRKATLLKAVLNNRK